VDAPGRTGLSGFQKPGPMARLSLRRFLLGCLLTPTCGSIPGAVKLDNYTLAQFVAIPGFSVFAKMDKSYAYGDKEDAFRALCKLAHHVRDLVVAEIPVQEYGEKENDDIREKFGVKVEEFPVFFLFKGSTESAVRFEGFPDPKAVKPATWDDEEDGAWEAPMKSDITTENLALWLRRHGIKMPAIGTIPELDQLAQHFMSAGGKQEDLEEATRLAREDFASDPKAAIYVKVMEKVLEKGPVYVEKELVRVKRIMAGKMTPEKQSQMADKHRVLSAFLEE